MFFFLLRYDGVILGVPTCYSFRFVVPLQWALKYNLTSLICSKEMEHGSFCNLVKHVPLVKPSTKCCLVLRRNEENARLFYLYVIYYSNPVHLYLFHWKLLRLDCYTYLLCSHNFDKLASFSHLLFPSCGFKDEILRTQASWSEDGYGVWHFEWDLNWTVKSEPGVQFCWLLSGTFSPSILFWLLGF